MNLKGILLYCLRAGSFALVICAVYMLACRLRRKRPGLGRLAAVAYFAALFHITVLRGGIEWKNLLQPGQSVLLLPFATTFGLLDDGLWQLIYNIVGNLIWFVPLGIILRRRRWMQVLAWGAGISACIEAMQFLLRTGITDIDDTIFNALGALIGWGICRINKKKCG